MFRKSIILLIGSILFFVFGNTASGQENSFETGGTYIFSHDDSSESLTEIQRTLIWASGYHRVPMSSENTMIFGVSYSGQFLEYDNFQTQTNQTNSAQTFSQNDMPEALHALDVSVEWIMKWSDMWTTSLEISPGIHSDFEDIDGDALMLRGRFILNWKFESGTEIGMGMAYSDSFGSPLAFPLLGIKWHPGGNWFVDALLPLNAAVGYAFSPGFKIGVEGQVWGHQYQLTKDHPWYEAVVNYKEIQIGSFIDYEVWKHIHLSLKGGFTTCQELEFNDEDDTNEIIAESDYDHAGFMTLGVRILF